MRPGYQQSSMCPDQQFEIRLTGTSGPARSLFRQRPEGMSAANGAQGPCGNCCSESGTAWPGPGGGRGGFRQGQCEGALEEDIEGPFRAPGPGRRGDRENRHASPSVLRKQIRASCSGSPLQRLKEHTRNLLIYIENCSAQSAAVGAVPAQTASVYPVCPLSPRASRRPWPGDRVGKQS